VVIGVVLLLDAWRLTGEVGPWELRGRLLVVLVEVVVAAVVAGVAVWRLAVEGVVWASPLLSVSEVMNSIRRR